MRVEKRVKKSGETLKKTRTPEAVAARDGVGIAVLLELLAIDSHPETPDRKLLVSDLESSNFSSGKKLLPEKVDSEGCPQGESSGRFKIEGLRGGVYWYATQAKSKTDAAGGKAAFPDRNELVATNRKHLLLSHCYGIVTSFTLHPIWLAKYFL
jgi:hypothetical protein